MSEIAKQFEVIPLTDDELALVNQHQLTLVVKPLYAPAIIKAWFRGHEWQMCTAETVAQQTNLELKQVKCILLRMVREKELVRCISKWKSKTVYYWFSKSL